MSNIDTLATSFLLSSSPIEKGSILNLVKTILSSKELQEKSPAQILKEIGVSYFGAVNSSQKMEKGKKENYDSYVIYLSPSDLSGVNMCRFASAGCIAACLNGSGHALIAERAKGKANPIAISRLKKTWLVSFNRVAAEKVICHEIEREGKRSHSNGHKFCARLNGTSDIFYGSIIKKFPTVQFYDYTKNDLFLKLSKNFPNWHLTFSFSGNNHDAVIDAMKNGFNVAFPIVGKKEVKELIASGIGFSMDETDLRFLDPGKGNFGLLTVKETSGTLQGIEKGFLLSKNSFLSFVAMNFKVRRRSAA